MIRIANRFEYEPDARRSKDAFLGQGGMGAVYKGIDTQTGAPVAIKLLKSDVIANNPEIVDRFRLEGEALRQLNHPNIVKMLDAVEEDDMHYLVMEYVGGGSLRDLLDKHPRLSIQRILYIALDLADALTRAHRLKILHRDIKPANVLLAEDGTPRLTDFGMARFGDRPHVTQEGAIVGTLAYLSPEAFQGDDLDERHDIWAFGVLLYEMLAGERPFGYEQMGPLINAILTQPVPDLEVARPDAPIALIDLIYRMLKKDRRQRIPSVRLVGAELEALIRGDNAIMQYVVSPDTTGRFDTPTPTPIMNEALPPHKLPSQATAFVGREQELAELQALLDNPAIRLITLLGLGGMGKTRLAIALADKQQGLYRDGIFFVPLAQLERSDLVMTAIADALDFTFGGASDSKSQLLQYLREKALLLILDNFEHLTDAAGLVGELLAAAPRLRVIVTSRERLRLSNEQLYEVLPMPLPSLKEKPESLATYSVAQLFVQSARRVQPDFELTADCAPQVARILHLVQGLPLGVELAAGWLEMMPIEEIASEIERSLDFLETDLRDVPERHRSLRAVFEYSWNLMAEEERAVFAKISVFRGGFEREAAQKVAGATLRNLTSLVNKSLLRRSPEGRYEVDKMLSQYAAERLAQAKDVDDVYQAHAMYYGEFLQRLQPALDTKHERDALNSIETELDNLRAAWEWAKSKRYWAAHDNVMHAVLLYYAARGLSREGMMLLRELADAMAAAGQHDNRIYWRARIRESWLLSRMGEQQLVHDQSAMAYRYFTEVEPNPLEACFALNNMSYAMMRMGHYDESIAYAQQAAQLAQTLKQAHPSAFFMSMGNLGYAEYLKGNYRRAKRIYEDLLGDAALDDYSPTSHAYGMNNLGEIVRELGDMDAARDLFQKAYDIFKSYQNRRGIAFTLNNLAGVLTFSGDLHAAKQMYQEALELHRDIGDLIGIGHSLSGLGNLSGMLGDEQEALAYFQQSLAVRREVGDWRGIADSTFDLAGVAAIQGRRADAERYAYESLEIRRKIGDQQGIVDVLSQMASYMLRFGDLDTARAWLNEALSISESTGYGWGLGQSYMGLGDLNLAEGRIEKAEQYYLRALQLGQEANVIFLLLIALYGIARVLMARGDLVGALALVTLILQYPRTMLYIREEVVIGTLDELTHLLSEAEAAQAMAHGKSLQLEAVVAGYLAKSTR